ncbi:Leghemoglobin Lb120 [Seminavis robusta]|uniref:Leghemoglobin Lb120 n=1 Tax=Seminavis robusta TaxID=568900 RepID=A0A9N8EK30_9STRA|nr:Leghemoglobin Lb120 [Seminavis robusta]|eukprot:Sro1234_g254920.1 Leghemoglobin Lb120 (309) ;mRNA; f:24619-25630
MSLEMECTTLFSVIDSWESLRRVPNHNEVAGTILFMHLFELCPATKVLFGFPMDMDPRCEEVKNSPRFQTHAKYMINMLDRALNMLGPDAELLGEILSDLGKKHARLGVQERFFPFMGDALILTLREVLGTEFTPDIESHWKEVYHALSTNIVKSMNSEKSVLDSWASLKETEDYEERSGSLLFRKLFALCPETKTLFGFPLDLDTESEVLLKSRRFRMHSKYFIEMLDKALGMVEAKQMEQNLKELGQLHAAYGVKPEFFAVMGEALFDTLESMLPDQWNKELHAQWQDVYARLSSQMIAAIRQAKK